MGEGPRKSGERQVAFLRVLDFHFPIAPPMSLSLPFPAFLFFFFFFIIIFLKIAFFFFFFNEEVTHQSFSGDLSYVKIALNHGLPLYLQGWTFCDPTLDSVVPWKLQMEEKKEKNLYAFHPQ